MANSWLFNPGGHCCGGLELFVHVTGCSPGSNIADATVQLWKDDVQIDETTTSEVGDAFFLAPALGDYEIVVYHDDYPDLTQDQSTVPFTLTESDIQANVLMTPCGVFPPTLQISDGLGWSSELTLTPATDSQGAFYEISRFVEMEGIANEGEFPLSCITVPDALIRVRYRIGCSEGFVLQVIHSAGGGSNAFYHFEDVEIHPSANSCPSSTQGHPGNAVWFVDATEANEALECDPFEATYEFDFTIVAPPGNSGNWYTFTHSPTLWLLGPGPVTYTVTK